ncbi:hypothetical protein ACAX43_07365 [Paraburkholderia sp. IW21]
MKKRRNLATFTMPCAVVPAALAQSSVTRDGITHVTTDSNRTSAMAGIQHIF